MSVKPQKETTAQKCLTVDYGSDNAKAIISEIADLSWFVKEFPTMSDNEVKLFAANYPFNVENPDDYPNTPTAWLVKQIPNFNQKVGLKEGQTLTGAKKPDVPKFKINKVTTLQSRLWFGNTAGEVAGKSNAVISDLKPKVIKGITAGAKDIDVSTLLPDIRANIKKRSKTHRKGAETGQKYEQEQLDLLGMLKDYSPEVKKHLINKEATKAENDRKLAERLAKRQAEGTSAPKETGRSSAPATSTEISASNPPAPASSGKPQRGAKK